MSIKKSLLEMTKDILSALDSDDVNSLSDSVEALQIASIIKSTYYETIAPRYVPSTERLLKITAANDSNFPTTFSYADSVRSVTKLWYNVGTLAAPEMRDLTYVSPEEFLNLTDPISETFVLVEEPYSSVPIKIRTDQHPTYYTSFDDESIYCDSYDSTVDGTLQESKIRALGTVFPTFEIEDSFEPILSPQYFPYLEAEARSMCFEVLKGGTTPKVDQAARRQKAHIQNDKHRTAQPTGWSPYGRN